MFAKLHESHGFLQPKALDPLTDVFLRNEPLGGRRIDLGLLRFLDANDCYLAHKTLRRASMPGINWMRVSQNIVEMNNYSHPTKQLPHRR
jgi:hypothetical protein